MKKDHGNMMSIFPAIFTTIAVAIILVFYVGWMGNVAKKDEIRQIGREYILAMETEGRLSNSMESSMRAELASKGLNNINLSGTTMTDVGYGNKIFLCIKGDLEIDTYSTASNSFQLLQHSGSIPIEFTLESTAKH
jgi:hypothetical protein